jgi:hypothetical protein
MTTLTVVVIRNAQAYPFLEVSSLGLLLHTPYSDKKGYKQCFLGLSSYCV